MWETYSAFANTLGGVILLGVEEHADRSLHPVCLPDPEGLVKAFWDAVNDPNKTSANILTDKYNSIPYCRAGIRRICTGTQKTRRKKELCKPHVQPLTNWECQSII
ncbi:MAG: hypothetical protein IJ422_00260 [Oscillospiraceae bacterium]|nr:hypothetical protein [Oscillospiraceae bacterium]